MYSILKCILYLASTSTAPTSSQNVRTISIARSLLAQLQNVRNNIRRQFNGIANYRPNYSLLPIDSSNRRTSNFLFLSETMGTRIMQDNFHMPPDTENDDNDNNQGDNNDDTDNFPDYYPDNNLGDFIEVRRGQDNEFNRNLGPVIAEPLSPDGELHPLVGVIRPPRNHEINNLNRIFKQVQRPNPPPHMNSFTVCTICLGEFGDREIGVPNCCHHKFCAVCLLEWCVERNICPLDRLVFRFIDVFENYFSNILIRTIVLPRR